MSSAANKKEEAPTFEIRKVAHAPARNPIFLKGRRDFFKYRDLGVTLASGGSMRAQVISGNLTGVPGSKRLTGWHYHLCAGQFDYILKGWVELEIEDGRTLRLEQGDGLFIPGGVRHNEPRTSDELEVLEVSVPSDMGTVPCDAPDGWPKG
jgi:mannose-6-phosphate isomerase-like protein (cupin superfamily)